MTEAKSYLRHTITANYCLLIAHISSDTMDQKDFIALFLTIKYFKLFNESIAIAIAGHGRNQLPTFILNLVDHLFWMPMHLQSEIGVGHPYTVGNALSKLKNLNYSFVFKVKSFNLPLIHNFIPKVLTLMQSTSKSFMVTQQCCFQRRMLGDLFIGADIDDFILLWNTESWYPTKTGLISLGSNLVKLSKQTNSNFSFAFNELCLHLNINELQILDFKSLPESIISELMKRPALLGHLSQSVDIYQHLWGVSPGYHYFDSEGRLTSNNDSFYFSNSSILLN